MTLAALHSLKGGKGSQEGGKLGLYALGRASEAGHHWHHLPKQQLYPQLPTDEACELGIYLPRLRTWTHHSADGFGIL